MAILNGINASVRLADGDPFQNSPLESGQSHRNHYDRFLLFLANSRLDRMNKDINEIMFFDEF